MKKRAAGRAAGMIVVSALLCAAVAAQPQPRAPQDTGSAPEEKPAAAELRPNTEDVLFEIQEPVGIARAIGVRDTLTPASDYGQILPYAAKVIGWKQDGTPDTSLYIAYNMHWEEKELALPTLPGKQVWQVTVDTDKEECFYGEGKGPKIAGKMVTVAPRSIMILIGKQE